MQEQKTRIYLSFYLFALTCEVIVLAVGYQTMKTGEIENKKKKVFFLLLFLAFGIVDFSTKKFIRKVFILCARKRKQ